MVGITGVFGAEPGVTTQTSDSQSQDGLQIEAKFYAERYGVTVDEALRRFKIQDEARPLEAELTDNYAETFGGLWVQHTPEFRIVVAFTRDDEATINPYLQGDLADAIKINTVKYSYNSLHDTQVSLLDPLRQLSIKSDTYIDIMNNCVVVNITKPNQLLLEDALKNGKLIIPDSVKIVTVDALATPEVNVYGGLSLSSGTTSKQVDLVLKTLQALKVLPQPVIVMTLSIILYRMI